MDFSLQNPMFTLPPAVISCSLCLILVLVARYWHRKKVNPLGLPFPPGPPPLPIIGNIHQAPKDHEWLRFTEWAVKCGPIVHFHVFGEHVVLLNTQKVAVDLLDKRSTLYSDRPRTLVMAAELVGWNQVAAFMSPGPRHKKQRGLLMGTVNHVAARKLWSLQERGAHKYLNLMASNPDQYFDHIRLSTGETLVMLLFGRECSESDFPYMEIAERNLKSLLVAASPYAYAVDLFPILRYLPEWFPGASFKKQARIWNKELLDYAHFPYEIVKNDMKTGKARPSFVATHINKDEQLSLEDEEDIMWAAANFYLAGFDTTVATVMTFLLAMCLNPHVQRKAQQELDSVVGTGRLPTLMDRKDLPYLNACVREVLRWYPPAPLGLPHRVTQTDYYEGYCIPKGATVINNIWAMAHDESMYSSPHEFLPERFMHSPSARPGDGTAAFGFGRRICPGMHVADSSLFIYMACTLAVFNIAKAKNPNGQEIKPEIEPMGQMVVHPKPFKCSIVPRSESALRLVRTE